MKGSIKLSPEQVSKLLKGEAITVNLREGTTALEIRAESAIGSQFGNLISMLNKYTTEAKAS